MREIWYILLTGLSTKLVDLYNIKRIRQYNKTQQSINGNH